MARSSPALIKLTARSVAALPVRPDPYDVFDRFVRGFHVRVHPSGVVSFALRYRDPAGGTPPRYHRFTIGRYGPLTPDAARAIALAKRADITAGGNPVRDARLRASAMSFEDACARFAAHLEDTRSVRHARETARLLRTHCAPRDGARQRDPAHGAREHWGPVSYTHLTLPTNREV